MGFPSPAADVVCFVLPPRLQSACCNPLQHVREVNHSGWYNCCSFPSQVRTGRPCTPVHVYYMSASACFHLSAVHEPVSTVNNETTATCTWAINAGLYSNVMLHLTAVFTPAPETMRLSEGSFSLRTLTAIRLTTFQPGLSGLLC